MSERDTTEPLGLLRDVDASSLSEEAEAARKRRVVARIEQVRASLAVASEQPAAISASRSMLALRWKPVAVVVLPLAAALLFWLQRSNVASAPLFVVASGEVVVESSEGPNRLLRDARWERGDDVTLATEASEATLVLPSRTALLLGRQTRATLERAADGANAYQERLASTAVTAREGVRVSRGSVKVSVSEPQERSVVVVTAQAEVVMRGTVFAVLITALPTEAQTNVVVQAGEASVLSGGREYRLTAGQAWASSANVQDEVEKVPMAGADAGATSSSRSERTPPLGPKVTSSDLGQQNRMFESARAARRGGQSNLALQRFAELMTTFPRSEQAHNARVEHFRLLRSLGRREEASRSARAYLSKYPRGFAAAEARELTR